jgi:hypothetical protein
VTEAAEEFQQLTQKASGIFFSMMQERHIMGEKKYGPIKFTEVNTLVEAMEEVVDIANYAMYTFMKLYVLNTQLQKITENLDPPTLGNAGFIPAGDKR